MQSWVALVQFAMGVGVLLYVGWPLLSGLSRSLDETAGDDAEQSLKESYLQSLSDLEYEYRTGKISESDYRELRAYFLRRARQHISDEDIERFRESIDEADRPPSDDEIEQLVRRARDRLS